MSMEEAEMLREFLYEDYTIEDLAIGTRGLRTPILLKSTDTVEVIYDSHQRRMGVNIVEH